MLIRHLARFACLALIVTLIHLGSGAAVAGDAVSGARECVPTGTASVCSCPPDPATPYPTAAELPRGFVAPSPTQPTTFRVATFNVLGALHTNSTGWGGHDASSFPDFCTRMAVEVGTVQRLDLDIIGFQELQSRAQVNAFRALAPSYDLWPGHAETSDFDGTGIAWNKTRWALVPGTAFTYRAVGQDLAHPNTTVDKPAVMLESLQTGQRVWVLDTHHPAAYDRGGTGSALRDATTDTEAALVKQMRAQYPDVPVLLFGDMNERGAFYCRLATKAAMISPMGGSVSGRSCTAPSYPHIDWIMSTPDIAWSGFSLDTGPQGQRATDHPIPTATAQIAGVPVDPRVMEILRYQSVLHQAHQVLQVIGQALGFPASTGTTVAPATPATPTS